MYIIGVIAVLIALIPQILVYLMHIIYFVSSKRKKAVFDVKSSTPREISFILPIRKEPPEYVTRALRYIKSLGIPDYEVILVSDDDEKDKEQVYRIFEETRKEGINVWLVWRSIPVGMRTGALNVGLYASRGRYIYVYDVDTIPEREFFDHACGVLEECETCIGVVGRWEPLNTDSRVSEALAYGLKFIRKLIFDARSKLGLHVYPLGTGTLYRSSLLRDVLGGWDPRRIQDDAELGVRLLCTGYQVFYLNKFSIKVENPSTYKSFRVQQSRWAYGALDAALSRLRCFLSSRTPLIIRLEALLYLLQYIPSALSFTGGVLLSAVIVLNPYGYVELVCPIFAAWLTLMVIYTLLMYSEVRREHLSLKEFLVVSGRLATLGMAISPYVTAYTLKALLRFEETYKRTPKGVYQKLYGSLRFPYELAIGVYFVLSTVISFINRYYLTSITLSIFALPFLYVTFRFSRDVFYK